MQAEEVLNYNFKEGVVEELYRKGLLNFEEKERAKEILKGKEEK